MYFEKLLNNCQALEKTVSVLVKSNSTKQAELTRLQNGIFDESRVTLDDLMGKEREMQNKLDALKYKKYDVDTEVKQYHEINEKLSDLVAVAQKEDRSDGEDNECRVEEISFNIIETLSEYDQVKVDFNKLSARIEKLSENLDKETQEIKSLIKTNQNLVGDLHRNDCILRISEQQNKYAEQQFDLILTQLPWEPLTNNYIDELRKSSDPAVRDIAEYLQLQKNEIEDLTESLNAKKTKKLAVLECLYNELNTFVQKRDEAALITRFND